MDDRNRSLQEIFLFSNADLRANRAGRLSERQQARLRAARGSQRLAMLIFVVVMIGAAAFVAFSSLAAQSSANSNPAGGLAQMVVIVVVVCGVALIGLLISRPYLTDPAPRQMLMASGPAQVGRVKPDAARYEIKIGAAVLRLATEEHLAAFQPGVIYQVFYLPGPVTTVLSGQVVGTEAEMEDDGDTPYFIGPDVVVSMQARARPVLIVLGVLALGIPAAGFAASALPVSLRLLVMAALLVFAIAFVYWALRRLSR